MKKKKEKQARWDEGVRMMVWMNITALIIAKKEQLKRLVIFLSYRKKEDKEMPSPPPKACVGQMGVKSFTLFSEIQTR